MEVSFQSSIVPIWPCHLHGWNATDYTSEPVGWYYQPWISWKISLHITRMMAFFTGSFQKENEWRHFLLVLCCLPKLQITNMLLEVMGTDSPTATRVTSEAWGGRPFPGSHTMSVLDHTNTMSCAFPWLPLRTSAGLWRAKGCYIGSDPR